jgi:hypothetical protein
MIEPRVYTGERFADGSVQVWRDGVPLDLRRSLRVRSHSPTGFEWGYGGSGPAQLALAILLDLLSVEVAASLYQDFKFQVVSGLDRDKWMLLAGQVLAWVTSRLQRSEDAALKASP